MRVGVFIDGQNVTIGARYAFGHGNMHPLFLARELAAAVSDQAELVEVRYATGLPKAEVDPERFESQRRRHDLMVATDVVVLEKSLRYRWQWDIRDRDLPRPEDRQGDVARARVKSRYRGQEKGVDVWLALDALVMCSRDDLDCVIIATADSDLDLVRDYVRMVPGSESTAVIQARVIKDGHELRQSPAWDRTVAIDRSMFEACRDDFDYSQQLDADAVAVFLTQANVRTDGLRD